VTLGTGNEIVTGSAGQDTVALVVDADSTANINLGAGADSISAAGNIVATATFVGGSGSDTLNFADDISVAAANLALTSGFDVITLADDTGGGDDNAVGLNDAVVGASDADTITINNANGDVTTVTAAVSAANTIILGDGGGTYTLAGDTRVTIGVNDAAGDGAANDASETLTLGTGNEIVTGSGGQDTVVVVADADSTANINLGAGADSITAAGNIVATATFVGGSGSDTLNFAADIDVAAAALANTSGFDVIALADNGGGDVDVGLDDTVVGGSDSDSITINGIAGDTVNLTAAVIAANTVILGDNGASFTLAGDTRATIGVLDTGTADGDLSNETTTTVTLGTGNEILTGSAGQDTVAVVADADSTANINLGAGADSVTGAGNIVATATFVGGSGSDTLNFAADIDVAAAALANTSGFDVIALADNGDGDVDVGLDDTVVGASDSDSITINGIDGDTVNLTAAASRCGDIRPEKPGVGVFVFVRFIFAARRGCRPTHGRPPSRSFSAAGSSSLNLGLASRTPDSLKFPSVGGQGVWVFRVRPARPRF
jgi:hypothetical protein